MSLGALRTRAAVFALAIGSISVSSPAQAQAGLSLPSASLSETLNALSRDAGVEILADPALLRGKRSRPVRGASTPEAALGQLLRGSGLRYEKRGNAFLIVRSASGPQTGATRSPGALSGQDRVAEQRVAERAIEVAGADGEGEAAIVVTGSRIARPELESPMPVSVISMETAQRVGRTNAYDALLLDPAVGPGIGPRSVSDPVNNSGSDHGIATVALRNMGTNRSLTLIDGMRRVSSSATSSAVDLNMIPPAMIDRIEIVTGGAAAIYGADAVTGAVNIITKDVIDGLNISANQGISQHGDGERSVLSISTGGKFADGRGSLAIGGTYSRSGAVYTGDRAFSRGRILFQSNPASRSATDGIPDRIMIKDFRQIFVGYQPSFYWAADDTNYIVDVADNVVRKPIGGTRISGGNYGFWSGGEGGQLEDRRMLQSQLEALAVIGKVKYDVTDAVTYEARFDYGRSHSFVGGSLFRQDSRANTVNNHGGDVAYLDNPYLPSALRQFMLTNNRTALGINRAYGNFPAIEILHDYESFTIFQGLGGRLADRLNWQAFYQYGRTTDDVNYTNVPLASRYAAARDVIADPATGAPVCRSAAARAAGCTPFNIFGNEPLTQAQQNYMLTDRTGRRVNTQQVYGASVAGDLLSLPYGDLSIALGVERRRETLDTVDDPRAATGEVAYFGLAGAQPDIRASRKVSEIYGELVVPVLRGLPFAHRLEVEGAYRYSDYSGYGKTDTWKLGATWEPIPGLALRGVRSRSVRAPNFGELYRPQTETASGSPADTCMGAAYNLTPERAANCRALGIAAPLPYEQLGPVIVSGGNPNLQPETSNSLTLGAVFRPRFLPGFDATIDYWNIEISNVIASFGAGDVYRLCTDLPSIDNVFCRSIQRDPVTHLATRLETFLVNAQEMGARGIDAGINYRRTLGEGTLGLSLKGTYLLKYMLHTTPGLTAGDVQYDGAYSNPRFRGTMLLSYSTEKLDFNLNTRFVSAANYAVGPTVTAESYPDNRIPSRTYNDISVGLRVDERFRIAIGVENVLDVDPPIFPYAQYGAGGIYDVMGRYVFTSINLKF
ncbi:TonB-dependent receptor [Sphingomonas colocasiae]|nr:TonB-dependent receptor [Sphingomonas colocasiae]